MIGFGNSDWSYDPFEKMVIFPPDPLTMTTKMVTGVDSDDDDDGDGATEEPLILTMDRP